MSLLRLLAGLLMAVGMTGAWILLALVVMAVSLYIARLVPLTGRSSSAAGRGSEDGDQASAPPEKPSTSVAQP